MVLPYHMLRRNRRISPGQIRILQTLWSARARRSGKRGRAAGSRQARLEYLSTVLGREIESSKELSWREANQAIRRLLAETGANQLPAQAAAVPERAADGGALNRELQQGRPA